jgi:hypothetical protein
VKRGTVLIPPGSDKFNPRIGGHLASVLRSL